MERVREGMREEEEEEVEGEEGGSVESVESLLLLPLALDAKRREVKGERGGEERSTSERGEECRIGSERVAALIARARSSVAVVVDSRRCNILI